MQSQPIIVTRNDGASLLIRAIYFIVIGWWLSGIWAAIAWLLCVTIIGLPLGLYMLNRLPQVVTLKPSPRNLMVTPSGQVVQMDVPQRPFL
ncbi:MAG TPA: YccF domain-containing protein, partial [Roseiflexaceae bacterium]